MNKQPLPDRLTIRKIKRVNIPMRFIFVDTETNRAMAGGSIIKHTLKLGHAIYWQREKGRGAEIIEHYEFDNSFDFWEWATKKIHARETIYLFSHNVTFDFLVLDGFRLLPSLSFFLKSLYYKFTTAVLRFHDNNKRLVIADTMNYFPVSIDKLARSVGRKKLKVDFENVDPETLKKRCRIDTEIIYLAVRTLVLNMVEHELGSFKPTAAAMAASVYRKSFMRHEIVTNHTPQLVAFEKSAYFGGFIGVQKLTEPGAPNLYKLDVNSMYPSVMLNNNYPTRITEFAKDVPIKMLDSFMKDNLAIARVSLHAKEPFYPVRSAHGITYPIGSFEAVLTTPLLRRALATGAMEHIHQLAIYEKARIFDDYIKHMVAQRLDAISRNDLASELFYKTLSNGLYGKFAQSETTSKVIGDAPINVFEVYEAFDPVKEEHWKEIHAGGSIVFVYQQGEARYTSYAIAAHVTDYARMKLFKLAHKAGFDNVFYMDTDSIITNEEGRNNLAKEIDEQRLGCLKVEEEGKVYAGLSKKDYILGSTRKMKGFDKNGIKLEDNVFKTLNTVGFYGAARRRLYDGAFWYEVNKHYNPYVKNVHIEHDGRITPIRLPDEAGYLGIPQYTYSLVTDLVNKTFNNKQRAMVGEWLEI
jgi:DNA polymerase family B